MTRNTRMFATLVGTLSLMFVGRNPVRADGPAAAAVKRPSGNVVLFGSSSMNDSLGHLMAEDLERQGFGVTRSGYAAAGLSRPDFIDISSKVKDQPITKSTAGVLVYLGGNDAQAIYLSNNERTTPKDEWIRWDEPRWSEVYQKRAEALINALCKRGARRVIVLPPSDVVSPKMQKKLDRIRELQQKAADASECGKFITTTGDAGHFAGAKLRAKDGIHLSHAGAALMWGRVKPKLLTLLAP